MKCDQCVAVMINGVYCHEHGCHNAKRKRRAEVTCPECDRVFDLTSAADTAEWEAGHDCEA